MNDVMKNGFNVLSEDELVDVEGGGLVFIGTVTACLTLGKLAFECGEKFGRFVYVALH